MFDFVFDTTLVPQPLPISRFLDHDFYSKLVAKKHTHVENSFDSPVVVHSNYLDYLSAAWSMHRPIVLRPDIIWYTILCEISLAIQANPEHYRSLFTTSQAKTTLNVPSATKVLPLSLVLEELQNRCPTNLRLFFPHCSTDTPESELAYKSAFLEAMTPYYSHGIYLCGIPSMRVEGTLEDWNTLPRTLGELLPVLKALPDLDKYLTTVIDVLGTIVYALELRDTDFMRKMFSLEECGSGHQTKVAGWFSLLFMQQPSLAYVQNFSSHVAKVPYKDITNGISYVLYTGLFSSKIDFQGFLVPTYEYVLFQEDAHT